MGAFAEQIRQLKLDTDEIPFPLETEIYRQLDKENVDVNSVTDDIFLLLMKEWELKRHKSIRDVGRSLAIFIAGFAAGQIPFHLDHLGILEFVKFTILWHVLIQCASKVTQALKLKKPDRDEIEEKVLIAKELGRPDKQTN